eukprot:CAMPEP_0115885412 /NCGR_PEP_ID=MMETSP0287-20121206/30663_1 /TAXON_ID=412157 /ORGANISM="Chrysochromulina rotalis, Strain UIO044" /LENGTH=32 /DNA_ID= /DNA_START= /DNA_END= /DNA_ORIENTATION=
MEPTTEAYDGSACSRRLIVTTSGAIQDDVTAE